MLFKDTWSLYIAKLLWDCIDRSMRKRYILNNTNHLFEIDIKIRIVSNIKHYYLLTWSVTHNADLLMGSTIFKRKC